MPDKKHPGDRPYYRSTKIESIDVIDDWKLSFELASVLKYISRLDKKPGENPIEALDKALWYLQREKENRLGK